VTLESSAVGQHSPLLGILAPLFGQLLCETSIESLDGRGWRPIPLSDPSDIELIRSGFVGRGVGGCCWLILLRLRGRVGIGVMSRIEVSCIMPRLGLPRTRLTSGVRCIYEMV